MTKIIGSPEPVPLPHGREGMRLTSRRRRDPAVRRSPPPPHGEEARGLTDNIWCPGPPREDCDHPERGWYHRDGRRCRGWRHWLHL